MGRKLGYRWRLREIMAVRGLYMTTDLAPLLEERGISLSAPQVYRLVTQTPERLSLRTLMAICDALGCTSVDLIEPVEEPIRSRRKASGENPDGPDVRQLRPRRAPRDDRAGVVVIGLWLLRPGRAGAARLRQVGPRPVLLFLLGAGQSPAVLGLRGGPPAEPAKGRRPGHLRLVRHPPESNGGTRRDAPGGHRRGQPARARLGLRSDRRGGRGGV
jgi:DNA-binding Xre family transcriptional regulator